MAADTVPESWDDMDLDEFADKMAESLESQPPQITDEEIDQIEKLFGRNRPFGPWRRAALASLTMSGQKLIDSIENDREAALMFAEISLGIHNYGEKLRDLADLMQKAHMRIAMVLCWRDDMEEVLAESKANYERPRTADEQKRDREFDWFIEQLQHIPSEQPPLINDLVKLTGARPDARRVLEKYRRKGLSLEATVAELRKPAAIGGAS